MKYFFTTTGSNGFSAFWCQVLILCGIVIVSFTNTGLSQTVWSEDWEGNWVVDWHVDNGTWEVGTPTSGPDSAFNGQNCAATVLAGNYSEPVDSRLIRHTSFVVPPASENPRLRFWYWFSFSAADNGEVQIKTSSGEWESISNVMSNYGSNAWSYGSVDISAYADSTVQIAFDFHSVNSGGGSNDVSSGWYIDDVSLITGPYVLNSPEDFESGFGDWSVDEGSWEVGIPTSGPSNSHSGQNCAGTNLEGNYQEPADSRLVSPSFVVPPVSKNPAVQFWHWFSFSAADYGEVQIRVNNGNWQPISSQILNTSSGIWTNFYISLTAYADSTVQIAFDFHSVNSGGGSNDVSSGWYIDEISIVGYTPTSIHENVKMIPDEYSLQQNYPNPFNPSTTIRYAVSSRQFVTLKVYDVLGNEATSLVKEEKPAGYYEVEFDGSDLTSGIYFYKLQAGTFVETKKMIFMK